MEVKYTLFDEKTYTEESENILEVIPFESIHISPHLKSPFCGLIQFKMDVLPVLGPLPGAETNAWIMVYKDHAQIVHKLPEIVEIAPSKTKKATALKKAA